MQRILFGPFVLACMLLGAAPALAANPSSQSTGPVCNVTSVQANVLTTDYTQLYRSTDLLVYYKIYGCREVDLFFEIGNPNPIPGATSGIDTAASVEVYYVTDISNRVRLARRLASLQALAIQHPGGNRVELATRTAALLKYTFTLK